MLEVRNLSAMYGQHRALDNVSVQVGKGEIVVILGANGAGKSTLLRAISGVCEGQVSGSVRLQEQDLSGTPAHEIVEAGIALVPEGRGIFGELTVLENLTLGAYSRHARGEEAANLDRVHLLFPKLAERHKQMVSTMSGGEQQMVAIGRAMMSNPTILTLDEPSLGLSPLLCKELFQNLKAVRDTGIGILLVEQNARQSLAIADRGYLLENAHIIHEDSAEALIHDPAVQKAYLGAGSSKPKPQIPTSAPDIATAAMAALVVPTPRARSTQTHSADTLLGRSVADIVAQASDQSRGRISGRDTRHPTAPDTAAHGDRLRAALSEIEQAAVRAMHRRK